MEEFKIGDKTICISIEDMPNINLVYTEPPKRQIKQYDVIFNAPATILFVNGKKYVAKAHDEEFDAEKGLALALLKSFGISYIDLQRMIKNAKWQKNEHKKDNINTSGFMDVTYSHKQGCPIGDVATYYEPKPKRCRPRKIIKQENNKPKYGKRGRPRKISVGDWVTPKILDKYKHTNKEYVLGLPSKLLVKAIDTKDDTLLVVNPKSLHVTWFKRYEVELVK